MIFIDEVPLSELLEKLEPDSEAAGLVPAWLDWMVDEREQAAVWERMMPPARGTVAVPVLVCPDDLDFSCSVVIADVEAEPDQIRWCRLGLDATGSDDPDRVGERVHWFEGVPAFVFKRDDYEACVKAFQDATRSPQG